MSDILRKFSQPSLYYRFTDLGWSIQCLYADSSDNLFYSANSQYGKLDTNLNRTVISTGSSIWDYASLNYSSYNGSGISMNTRFPNQPSKVILVNSTYPAGILFTVSSWPISAINLVTTGCAIFGNKFYVVGSYTTSPKSMTIMQTTLDPLNTSNPFGRTDPVFTQTYTTYTAGTNIYGNHNYGSAEYTGMCTFDTQGNLYITSFGSGVYMYPVGSTFSSTPSLFISSTNKYSVILYNSVFNIFYVQKLGTTNNLDVYSDTGSLIKSDYVSNVPLGGTNGSSNSSQLCCDSKGNIYYGQGVGGNPALYAITPIVCFKKDTQILTLNGYRHIQHLKKGDLVKTLKHGYVPIYKIGFSEIDHPCVEERVKEQLYKCSPDNYPEVFEDLVLTGCHCMFGRESTLDRIHVQLYKKTQIFCISQNI
jgi:hypothetical protein